MTNIFVILLVFKNIGYACVRGCVCVCASRVFFILIVVVPTMLSKPFYYIRVRQFEIISVFMTFSALIRDFKIADFFWIVAVFAAATVVGKTKRMANCGKKLSPFGLHILWQRIKTSKSKVFQLSLLKFVLYLFCLFWCGFVGNQSPASKDMRRRRSIKNTRKRIP